MKTRLKKKRLKAYCEHIHPFCTIRSDVNWSLGYSVLKEYGYWLRRYYRDGDHSIQVSHMIDLTHEVFIQTMFG